MGSKWPAQALWVALLLLEAEYLAAGNYELRTEIRALLQIPLFHLTFSFLAFAIFLYRLQLAHFGGLRLDPVRWPWAVAHFSVFLAIASQLHAIERALSGRPVQVKLMAWCVVLLAFGGSWLCCLLRPWHWKSWLARHYPWLAAAAALAILSLGIIEVSNWLWRPLASATLTVANALLVCIYDDVVVSFPDYQLGTSDFAIIIEPGCSGYEGIGLALMFTLIYLWLRRADLSFPGALWLLPLGCAINWLLNGLRIATLVVIGTNFSPQVAMRGFHSQAGWLAFVATSACLVLVVEQTRWFRQVREDEELGYVYPARIYLLPFIAILLGAMLGGALETGFSTFYPVRILLAASLILPWWRTYSRMLAGAGSGSAVAMGLMVYGMWYLLVPGQPAPTVWEHLSPGLAWTWIAFRVVGSSVVIPLAEELAFRGYLMRRLQSSDFEMSATSVGMRAWLISSLLFGLLHGDRLAATLAGLAYGHLYRRSGSLGQAVVAHGVTNLCICVQVLTFGHWTLWS